MNILILLLNGFPFAALPVFVVVGGWLLYLLITKSPGIPPTPPPELIKAGECLKSQAIKRHGVMNNDDAGKPKLTFPYNGAEISVAIMEAGKGSPRLTFATFQTEFFPDRNFRIASGKFKAVISSSRMKNFKGEVCRKYAFEGSDGEFINRLMTEEIQTKLVEFQSANEIRFGAHTNVRYALKSAPGRFYFSTDDFLTANEDYAG